MRVTIDLDPDIAATAERLRRASGVETTETVNLLLRRALTAEPAAAKPFVQRTRRLGSVST